MSDVLRRGRFRLVLHAKDARADPCSDGVLFDLRSFTGFVIRLGSWESGLQLERIVGQKVSCIEDDAQLAFLNELGGLDPKHPSRRWAEPIAARLVDLVRRMETRQLAVLRTIRHCPAAMDLLGGGEHLLWLLAAAAAERETPWTELSDVLQRRRRDVLEWCGGQNSKAAVKAVERCKVSWFNDGELEELRKTAAQVTRRDLAREALERRHPELLEYPFYVAAVRKLAGKRLSERPETRELPRLLRDVHLLASALKLDDIDARLRALRQMEALRQLHNQLVEQLLDRHEPLPFSGQERFPAPPLGGSSTIVPIQTLAELEHEGRVMHHCCATYAGLVRDHVSYIYRVLEPERATLELDLTASRPQLVQLRGVGDDPVSRETRQAVLDWYKAGLVEWQPRQEKKRRRKR